jgi:hypothetical protein
MRTGVETALDFPGFAAARTGLTEADFTESDSEAVAAEATDGTIRATAASAETIFFIQTPVGTGFLLFVNPNRHDSTPMSTDMGIFENFYAHIILPFSMGLYIRLKLN